VGGGEGGGLMENETEGCLKTLRHLSIAINCYQVRGKVDFVEKPEETIIPG
jgi:hypothetical protein